LGARQATGFVGDTSSRIAEKTSREVRQALGRQEFDDSLGQGAARGPAAATRLALAALTTVIGD
jgi:hypothetical protein